MGVQYDNRTAVTFLMIGLGVGALLSMILSPRRSNRISVPKSDARRAPGLGRMSA